MEKDSIRIFNIKYSDEEKKRIHQLIDEVIDAGITIKVIGHQWYWSYEYSDYSDQDGGSIEFDSYMVATSDVEEGVLLY